MLVYFEELPLAGRDFVWQLLTLDEDCGCEPDGPLEARCHVQPAGPGRATIEGRLSGTVLLQCDRCLRTYPFQLDAVKKSHRTPLKMTISVKPALSMSTNSKIGRAHV